MSDFLDHLIHRARVHEPVIQPRSRSYFEPSHSEESNTSLSETEWSAQPDRPDHTNKDNAATASRPLDRSQLRSSSSFVKTQEQPLSAMDHVEEVKSMVSSPEFPCQPSGSSAKKPDESNLVDTGSSEVEPLNEINPHTGTTERSTIRSIEDMEFVSESETSEPTAHLETERKSNVTPDDPALSKQEEKSASIKPNRIISASVESNQILEDRFESPGTVPSTEESPAPKFEIDRTANTPIKPGTKASNHTLPSFTHPSKREAEQDVEFKINQQNIPITPTVKQKVHVQETAEIRGSILSSRNESVRPITGVDQTANAPKQSEPITSEHIAPTLETPVKGKSTQENRSKRKVHNEQHMPLSPALKQKVQLEETAKTGQSILSSHKEDVRPSISVDRTINTPSVSASKQSDRNRPHAIITSPDKYDALSNIAVKTENKQTSATTTVNTPSPQSEKVAVTKNKPADDSTSHLPHRGLLVQPTMIGEIHPMQQHHRDPATRPEPTIHVNIGRIEVKAMPPPTAAPQRKPRTKPSMMSLDDYLLKRDGGASQ